MDAALDWHRNQPSVTSETSRNPIAVEVELVAGAKVDRQAFALLYTRYFDSVYRYCYRRLGSREDAEDATSEVFCKVLAALSRYHDGSFGCWVFAIAHNVVISAYRRRRPHQMLDMAVDIADEVPTPEECVLLVEQRRWVRELLSQLPPHHRTIVELRLAGRSNAEIAVVLGRSPESVKSIHFRAIARLRMLLEVKGASE